MLLLRDESGSQWCPAELRDPTAIRLPITSWDSNAAHSTIQHTKVGQTWREWEDSWLVILRLKTLSKKGLEGGKV